MGRSGTRGRVDAIAYFGRELLDEHQESLQHGIGESWADRHILHQALNIIDHHGAQGRLVGGIKDLHHHHHE